MTDNKFIAFFDVLGFKNLVEKNSHETLMSIYEDALCDTVFQISRTGIDLYKNDETAVKSLENIKKHIISDSIILIQNDFSHRGFFFLILQCRVLLSVCMDQGIPLRGAISLGPVSILENFGTTIVGKGLTNAYTLESIQNWSGAIIDDSCFEIHPGDKFFLEIMNNHGNPLVVDYKVPTKNSENREYRVINWTSEKESLKKIEKSFSQHGKEINTEKEKLIVSNTLDFVKFCNRKRPLFKKIKNAQLPFDFLKKAFGTSISTVSNESLKKLVEPNKSISFIDLLLESPFYNIQKVNGESFIKHSLSEKLIRVDDIDDKIEKSFAIYKDLSRKNKIKVLNRIL